jgi:TIR domain
MRIFISYANEENDTATAIAHSLRQSGHKVFIDRGALQAGKEYDNRIKNEIRNSHVYIFLITPAAVSSGRYTLTELAFAKEKWRDPHGHVLPVMLEETPLSEIPPYLRAVTILMPAGNVVAEVTATVGKMRRTSRRLAMLIFILMGMLIGTSYFWAPPTYKHISACSRAIFSQEEIPLNPHSKAVLRLHIDSIAESLDTFLRDLPNTESRHTPWEVAQASVALNFYYETFEKTDRYSDRRIDNVQSFFDKNLGPFERSQSMRALSSADPNGEIDSAPTHLVVIESRIKTGAHVPATSWVLMAYSSFGKSPPVPLFDFILDMQHPDGWWPIYGGVDTDDDNATVYATTTASWALLESVYAGQISNDQRERAITAIRRGLEWVRDNSDEEDALWKVYPNRPGPTISDSVSGNAVYVMHRSHDLIEFPLHLNDVDESWLRLFKTSVPTGDSYEQSQDKIYDPEGEFVGQDQTRYWLFPWMVAGTAAAYENGTTPQKAKTIKWFERTILNHNPGQEVKGRQWLEAEILIALLYLHQKSEPRGD